VARLLAPENAAVDREVGVGRDILIRWREWTAAARLEAVIVTAALDKSHKSAWCREHDVYPDKLLKWCASATTALGEREESRASPQATRLCLSGGDHRLVLMAGSSR